MAERFDDALVQLYGKHQEQPDDVEIAQALCYGLNIRSYHKEAGEVARISLENNPGDSDLYYELIISSSLDAEHELESILEELGSLVTADRGNQGARRNLALTQYYLENDEDAEATLAEVLKDFGEDDLEAPTYEVLAQIEYTAQDMERCIVWCDKSIDALGPSARLVRLKGLCLQEMGENQQALQCYLQALKLEPNFTWACHSLGSIYIEMDNYAQAFRYFGQALAINPTDPGNLFIPAEAYMDMGRYDLAVAELNKLLMLEPDERIEAEVHNALGYIAVKEGKTAKARLHLNKAVALEPELAPAYFNMGQLAQQEGDTVLAENQYLQALELDDQLSEALVELGFIHLNRDQLDQAEARFKEALEFDELDAQAHVGRSKIAQKNGDAKTQLALAKKAFECDPDHSEVCNNLAIAHEVNDDLDAAEDVYIRALEINHDNAAAANNLGHLYQKLMKAHPEEEESYRKQALWAWKERLRICLKENKSTEAAVSHLSELGLSEGEIRELARTLQESE